MAKAAIANNEGGQKQRNQVVLWYDEFSSFLTDVRGEIRKVVTPSLNEVKATTGVVLIAVMLFSIYFFLADSLFSFGLKILLAKLGGTR